MENRFKKGFLCVLSVALLSACQGGNPGSSSASQSKESEPISSSSSTISPASSSSSEPEVTSSQTIQTSETKESSSSEEPPIETSTISSSEEESSEYPPCDEHEYEESIYKKATIVEKGIKRFTCKNCGRHYDEEYYDLDEYSFENMTYSYDGKPHQILIEGMLPYGLHVEYENNVLTEIGTQEATAKILDDKGNLIETKKANIAIVENVGFANLRLTTETGEDPDYKERDLYTNMTVSMDNCADDYAFKDVAGGIRIRGNSTNQDEVTKRAWRLKLDKKRNMLGLNGGTKEKSWVLLADYFDQSMMRNATAFTFGNSLFNHSGNYCTDFKHVNFYMNDDYRGVYLLAEQQQAKPTRVPINEAEDYEGTDVGYLVELDGLANKEDYYFTIGSGSGGGFPWGGGESINGTNIPSKDYAIKTDVFGDQQLPFIKKYMNNVFTILKNIVKGEKMQTLDENNDLIDSPYKTAYETLDSVIDMESFFKTYVLQEYMRNYDVGWGSFYFFVDFSETSTHKKLTFGAPWDFDWSSGNPNSSSVNKSTGSFCNSGSHMLFNPWLFLLSQTDFFAETFPKYYSVFASSSIYERAVEYINYETSAFATEFDKNYTRWGTLNGQKPDMYTRKDVVSKFTCHADASEFLLNWMKERKDYMDGKYLGEK